MAFVLRPGRPRRVAAFACFALALLTIAASLRAQSTTTARPAPGFADAVLGRWDLTVHDPTGDYPSWLEVRLRTENELMGDFVGRVGSVRHVTAIDFDAGNLRFAVPPQYEPRDDDLVFEGRLAGAVLEGVTEDDAGREIRWTGRRAPALIPDAIPEFEPARTLIDGNSLAGWHARGGASGACWQAERGELVVVPPCFDLVSDERFDDFMLHAEFRYPAGSNSGIYLRGRYEVQIQDDAGRALDALRLGGVYGFIAPVVDAARAADTWQTLDITLVGRRVTVVLNGTTIISGQDIPGITGGALDSREADPGPIMLQGDHRAIRYRNLTIRPARSAPDRPARAEP